VVGVRKGWLSPWSRPPHLHAAQIRTSLNMARGRGEDRAECRPALRFGLVRPAGTRSAGPGSNVRFPQSDQAFADGSGDREKSGSIGSNCDGEIMTSQYDQYHSGKGRIGARPFGVSTSGAMIRSRVAGGTQLLGNDAGLPRARGPDLSVRLAVRRGHPFALTGGDCAQHLAGRAVPPVVYAGKGRDGSRDIGRPSAVRGPIDVRRPESNSGVMGSRKYPYPGGLRRGRAFGLARG